MRKLKFAFSLFLGIFLIVLPEPLTTAVGLGILSWAIIHYMGLPESISGTCRCDYCRMGLSRHGDLCDSMVGNGTMMSMPGGKATRLSSIRRAQATLPLTRGKGYIQTNRVQNHCLKGGW